MLIVEVYFALKIFSIFLLSKQIKRRVLMMSSSKFSTVALKIKLLIIVAKMHTLI